ncbi:hypothetical protein PTKIN_Ptkin14bG0057200 [Pterospermum kingtungense]
MIKVTFQVRKLSWYYLKDAVLEGGVPSNKVYGMTEFEYFGKDLRLKKALNAAMSNHSTITMKKILETYDGFEGLKTLVDVGGSIGASLNMIISKYPSIKGINFDLPYVIEDAPAFPGVEHVGGDMFVSVPKGDAIFLKWICHDWSDEHCLKFLKTCYEALPDNGKVIVAEYMIPDYPDPRLSTKSVLHLDCIMLTHTLGGRERTEKEFEALAKGAGFQVARLSVATRKERIENLEAGLQELRGSFSKMEVGVADKRAKTEESINTKID